MRNLEAFKGNQRGLRLLLCPPSRVSHPGMIWGSERTPRVRVLRVLPRLLLRVPELSVSPGSGSGGVC